MKKSMKSNLLSPLPVVLIGSLVNNKPNFLVVGYSAPFNFGKHLFFSIYRKRYTFQGIVENQTFSVNIPSAKLLEKVEICGSKSGRDIDKSELFDIYFGELDTAPLIGECPISIECEVAQMLDFGMNFGVIGKVVMSYADSECLVDGKLDFRKVDPIIWATGGDFNYYQLGNRIGIEKPYA